MKELSTLKPGPYESLIQLSPWGIKPRSQQKPDKTWTVGQLESPEIENHRLVVLGYQNPKAIYDYLKPNENLSFEMHILSIVHHFH